MKTIYVHGNPFFGSCEICDKGHGTIITWNYKHDDTLYVVTVCNDCFNDRIYQEVIASLRGVITKVVNVE